MTAENNKKTVSFKKLIKTAAIIALAAALICIITPSLRKKDAVSTTGNEVISSMRAASQVISYYAADDIYTLAAEPALNEKYKEIAGLMAQLSAGQEYEKMYLIARDANKKLQYISDGSYRDNGQAGSDYYPPAAAYPEDNGYKAVKSIADKIYSGKSTGDYISGLVTRPNLKKAVVCCLPIYGDNHSVIAILGIEADPGDTAYHMIGSVNLYYAGLILLASFAVCLLILIADKKIAKYREEKKLAKEKAKENSEAAEAEIENTLAEEPADLGNAEDEQPCSADDVLPEGSDN